MSTYQMMQILIIMITKCFVEFEIFAHYDYKLFKSIVIFEIKIPKIKVNDLFTEGKKMEFTRIRKCITAYQLIFLIWKVKLYIDSKKWLYYTNKLTNGTFFEKNLPTVQSPSTSTLLQFHINKKKKAGSLWLRPPTICVT